MDIAEIGSEAVIGGLRAVVPGSNRNLPHSSRVRPVGIFRLLHERGSSRHSSERASGARSKFCLPNLSLILLQYRRAFGASTHCCQGT